MNNVPSIHDYSKLNGSSLQIPNTVLDAFFPGYSLIAQFLEGWIGIDVGIVVSTALLFIISSKAGSYLWDTLSRLFRRHLTCQITVDEDDDFYLELMKWYSQQPSAKNSRAMKVSKLLWLSHGIREAAQNGSTEDASSIQKRSKIFNYRAWREDEPLQFAVKNGQHAMWRRGRLFSMDFYEIETEKLSLIGRAPNKKLFVDVRTFGRDTTPIMKLLNEIRLFAIRQEAQASKTTVFRPRRAQGPYEFHPGRWISMSRKTSRPLSTVNLDATQKLSIVADINDFIHPTKERWYSSRGIPYRRGYCFTGPPGTGKSSMSFALAGLFGMDLYAVSLQDPDITEGTLLSLFNSLPERCILLLEDIDSSGLSRSDETDSDTPSGKKTKNKNKRRKSNISLSGLLNAIDSPAAHEGHILILTTNHPDKLDEALVRPGRVDMHVNFTLASQSQAREMFLRMFTDEKPAQSTPKPVEKLTSGASLSEQTVEGCCREQSAVDIAQNSFCPFMFMEDLCHLAEQFAACIPEQQLSPAEIQGFLLKRKSEPFQAVDEVGTWARDIVESRKITQSKESREVEDDTSSEEEEVSEHSTVNSPESSDGS